MVPQVWSLVLAGGDGTRLAAITKNADGVVVPKQFCRLTGGRSLLEETLERADRLASRARTVTVVTRRHEAWWRALLRGRPRDNVVVQGVNRGTAAGLLIPISHIMRCAPDAQLVVLPSDHYVADEATLRASIRRAIEANQAVPDEVVLLGIRPRGPESGYGWIVPERKHHGGDAIRVARFVEKPPVEDARALMRLGGLWSPFILVGMVRTFHAMAERALPAITTAVDDCVAAHRLDRCYPNAHVAAGDFCHDVLVHAADQLRVVAVPPCGWSDVGTPERLRECLAVLPARRREHVRGGTLPGVRALV